LIEKGQFFNRMAPHDPGKSMENPLQIFPWIFHPMTDPNGAAFSMVCHGSHQYTPGMLA
jgi:hypothetical protein